MTKPTSFSTICTSTCSFELVGLLLSLSVYHTNEKIYILCDTKTKQCIEKLTPQPKLNISWFVELDKYTNMNRSQMTENKIWSEFQMSKALVIKYALQHSKDTLFLDSDIIITDVIDEIDTTKELGVSPQFISKEFIDKTGYYNGGVLWTKNKNVPDDWMIYTKTSRYYDQASIEDLSKKYSYFEFGENYNLQCWRWFLSPDGIGNISHHISTQNCDKMYYKQKPLKFIHTHFNEKRFSEFNNYIITQLKNAKMYKILAIIYRMINNKWVLKIPKQPMNGMGFHKNDSYRELAVLLRINNLDVDVNYVSNTINCWLEPNILTYDRHNLNWVNNETGDISLILLGNGDILNEGKQLSNKFDTNVKPWIFWPRAPMLLEKILKKHNILSYNDRTNTSIFIGNFENSIQEKYRTNNVDWGSVITEYHCTKGSTHLFTHEEYLMKLRNSKYGLCLRGYGSKCHREVELMAFGTVPIITPNMSVSYLDALVENIHYIYANTPEELQQKIHSITKEQWEQMSKNCYNWYQQNVFSKNCWNNMIEHILYDK